MSGWERIRILGATLFLTALFAHGASAQSFPYSASVTYYTGIDAGNCSFGPIETQVSPFGQIVAVGNALYGDAANCGRFIEIDTTGATCAAPPCEFTGDRVVVMISDRYPGSTSDLDLSESAFEALASPIEGLLHDVHWRFVPGTHAGNILFHSTAGMNPYFLHFVLRDHNLGITQVEVRDASSAVWRTATRDSANQWAVSTPGGAFVAPLSVRITDVEGGVLTASDAVASIAANTGYDLVVQMSTAPAVSFGTFAAPLTALWIAATGAVVLWKRAPRR